MFSTLEELLAHLLTLKPGETFTYELHDFQNLTRKGLSPILIWLNEQNIHVAMTPHTPSRLLGLKFYKK